MNYSFTLCCRDQKNVTSLADPDLYRRHWSSVMDRPACTRNQAGFAGIFRHQFVGAQARTGASIQHASGVASVKLRMLIELPLG